MSRGKYLSLEEALKSELKGATLKQFCKEHPSEGDEGEFGRMLERMATAKPKKEENPKNEA